mmetsp:Transcript_18107/g.29244  ORF Transcript_18107/g.29244 Transcript_18107/m.29244 type:complete len:125 (+) Transcript_18107:271-645(+)|eukprot:CAMPEP_0178748438 /NCGR_PEP_ID=MMETSP0744-20121128/8882_1 /TAXON_ID=913974 /ORGANISM="Nitzschia punctata, Strain CCMP561" /LENGTH=124 /DNA_ID=CAMNT_0020401795 /DNA_START=770 /DNA_END=1144 /DNA_ORIENTATION=+
MSQQTNFATQALERCENDSFLKELPMFEIERRMSNSSTNSLKRSRPSSCSFDMSDFAEASKLVEESMAFPAIEWPSFDGDDEDDAFLVPPTKRQCQGLVRCNRSSNLSSLTTKTERRGSNGSLA